jgi:hypothetical protein
MILVKAIDMAIWIWFAAVTSAATFYVHSFVGGPLVAGPLLATNALPPASKWLNYYCWHVTTVLLAFLTGAFVWLAMHPDIPSLVFLLLLCAALSALSALVARKAGIAPWRFPSTTLFAAIATLCAFGLMSQ